MTSEFWHGLKSGTDIRGVAVDGLEDMKLDLSDEVVERVISAFVYWLCEDKGYSADKLVVSIGRDSRITGEHILTLSANTMSRYGVKVFDCGLASTPSMFMTTVDGGCDAAIMVTASHHPYYKNGLKFFLKNIGGLEGSDIAKILLYAESVDACKASSGGSVTPLNYMERYCDRLRKYICSEVAAEDYDYPLKGMKIAVDAGNGAGGFYATSVLKPLGADVSGSCFLNPDGMFPNHIPNPENKDAMRAISKAVVDNNCDLGVIFDTDVDRGAAVDCFGNEISRNRLVALASAIVLENNPGATIVTDSITSDGLNFFIETVLGGKHHRFKRGYKNVINESLRLNSIGIDSPLAIETSGHAAMKENYFLDDGAYLCTKIIIMAVKLRNQGKTLNDILKDLPEPAEAEEYRIKITTPDFKAYGNNVIDGLIKYAAENNITVVPNNYEGVRLSFDRDNGDGWCLLRLSVHDPIMPLNIESNSKGGVNEIIKRIKPYLSGCDKLDFINLF
ncbi:MAG: phosphomannomutase/phosphoglucomutase [Clostridia bacterium]|nr:phosphomannomutase/phosphoglucomutase [Clostridia bacterium]